MTEEKPEEQTLIADEVKLVELLNHNPALFHNKITDVEIKGDVVEIEFFNYGE